MVIFLIITIGSEDALSDLCSRFIINADSAYI
jgi:hypothetical protein